MTRMRYEKVGVLVLAALTAGTGACLDNGSAPTGEILATGVIAGGVYLDRSSNGLKDQNDPGLGGIAVRIAHRGSTTPIMVDTTRAPNGDFRFEEVPVGAYWLTVDSIVLGDSLEVVQVDTASLNVRPGITTTAGIGLSLFQFTIPEARTQPVGAKVSVEGFALNDRTLFGDSTVHITDGTTSLRATTVFRSGVQQGDSVRLVGRITMQNGQPVIDRVNASVLAFTGVPQSPLITSLQAATATRAGQPSGSLDAGHVRVPFVTVIDTATVTGGDFRIRVNDGSGLLQVILDKDIPFNRNVFQVDSVMTEIRGLLLPTGTGTWDVKPRGMGDIIP